ncbi:hypothetical protein diail_1599 [Diaporthe ilicicola]|nr:hypothetical protein diail_1599 [Diaporthe ilicicola]
MPRWDPIPSAVCHEKSTDPEHPPTQNPKTNGYIFGGGYYTARVCRAMPLYPRTYGLSCDRPQCRHCHPETAGEFPSWYYQSTTCYELYRSRHPFSYTFKPKPRSCLVGRKGCRPEKMIYIRPQKTSDCAVKDETRRRTSRIEQAVEDKQVDSKHDKTQRLSKWETSASRPIDEGLQLAMPDDIVLPSDDWKADSWDDQLALLASFGLLDDYEAEDADITLNSLGRDEDTYTIRYKTDRRRSHTRKAQKMENIKLEDDMDWGDWEFVPGSPSEGSVSWAMLDG